MKTLLIGIKNALLWNYERGTWQYDILCLLIIGAVFLVPSSYFGDRDRPLERTTQQVAPQANEVPKVASKEAEINKQDIGIEEFNAFSRSLSEAEQSASQVGKALSLYLREQLKRDVVLDRYEVQYDSRDQIIGYRVWYR
jgi:hypothetical protein